MSILNQVIAKIAALLAAAGIPAAQSPLFALILIYLLVTGIVAVLMVWLFLRRRHHERQPLAPPSDEER